MRRLRNQKEHCANAKNLPGCHSRACQEQSAAFHGRVEEDTGHKTRVHRADANPVNRVALFRMIASLFLFGMAILWLQVGRIWLEQSLA